MRLKYYLKVLRQMNVKKSFALILIFISTIIVISFIISVFKNIIPLLLTMSESRAKALALKITNETVKEELDEMKYENLMNLTYDTRGSLVSISANTIEMNKLSSKISSRIQEKLLEEDELIVNIPIGKLLGLSIFSGYGPKIKIKIMPTGNVDSSFKTEFVSQGINQTKHTINIEITTSVKIVTPFISDTVSSTNIINVAETVIIGDIPSTYYNIEGIEDLSKNDIKP